LIGCDLDERHAASTAPARAPAQVEKRTPPCYRTKSGCDLTQRRESAFARTQNGPISRAAIT
jgi:hypothetical protein